MTDLQRRSNGSKQPGEPELGELFEHITADLKMLAHDELELARIELWEGMQRPIADAAAIVLGGVLVLIGLGLLCTTVVVALAPLLPALWLRMSTMSVVYLALGAAVSHAYMQRLRRDAPPAMTRTRREMQRTAQTLRTSVSQEAKHG